MRVANLKICFEEIGSDEEVNVQIDKGAGQVIHVLEEVIAVIGQDDRNKLQQKSNLSPVDFAKKEYKARRFIDKIFDFRGFAQSPAWDIMLDLFAAGSNDQAISVTSACIAAACPGTTGLRWLTVLQDMGLLVRSEDPADRRRTIVSLSSEGLRKTRQALDVLNCS